MNSKIKILDRLCLGGLILIVAAIGVWNFKNTIIKKKRFHEASDHYSKSAKEVALAETNLKAFQSALEETRNEISAFHQKIPESADFGPFIKRLDTMMKARGIGLLSVNPLPIENEPFYRRVPVRLAFRGPFARVCLLIQDLENMERAVIMENLIIRKSGVGEECLVDLTASIFEQVKG
jgi:Tfp pilus assembly protein PilO